MFGGIPFPNRDKLSFDCSNTFEHELASADLFNLYITEDENSKLNFSWKTTAIDDTKIKRAFHTVTYVPSLAKTVVFGGLVYENGKPTRRPSLQDMVSIKFNQNKFIYEFEKLPSVLESVYISGHSTASSSQQDHIVCAYQQRSSEITTKIEPSSNLIVINIQSNTV